MAIMRHHSHSATYNGKKIVFTDHHDAEVFGEYDEGVQNVDVIMVLKSSIPSHTIGEKIYSSDNAIDYELGREVKDDGYMRTIEVTRC